MGTIGLRGILGFATAIMMMALATSAAAANPQERIDYWRNNYEELSPTDDPRAALAHRIFQRVLHTAGERPGVVPRLFITTSDPLNIALPIAIPDGWIILSKGTLDICYQEPERGDDRLAFVLAHELAHQLKDDFWHMKFFQALEASKVQDPQHQKVLEEVQNIASLTEQVLAKELQADEQGIVYASMAGFNTHAIVTQDDTTNFFADWVRALDPRRISGLYTSTPPTPQQRAEVVKARLRQILDKMDVFNLGIWFYQTGDYLKAIRAFEDFLRFFPSREVYHNLASSHHQLALQYYRRLRQDTRPLPFKLSLSIEPVTRASMIDPRTRGATPPIKELSDLFQEHMDKAVEFYKTAISLDPSYVLSYSNLGCALIMKQEYYRAIATLQDALKIAPDSPKVLNNLGVAFFSVENPRLATQHLVKAHELAPTYDAPLFNLGKIAHEIRRESEAKGYWRAYVQIAPVSPWADLLREKVPILPPPPHVSPPTLWAAEDIMGLKVAAFEDELPPGWGKPVKISRVPLEEEPFKVAIYPHGVLTVSQDGEILMIGVLKGYRGKSTRGIAIGSLAEDVLTQYGSPPRILDMTQGESWAYDAQGIVFQMREGKVVTWLLF